MKAVQAIVFISLIQLFWLAFPAAAPCPWIWTPETGKFVNEKSLVKDTPKAQYDFAKAFEKKKDYDQAIYEYRKLVKNYPTSSLAVYAQIGIGESFEKKRDYYSAFKEYQKVLENYPSYGRIFDIVERQYKIGNIFLSGGKRRLWRFNIVPARDKAIEVFEAVIASAPFSEFAPRSQFLIGEAYVKMGKLPEAVLEYQKVVDEYGESEFVDDARIQIGLCAYKLSRGPSYDQNSTNKAIETFRSYIRDYPNSPKVKEAKKKIAELEGRKAQGIFDVAEYYTGQKIYSSARLYYDEVIQAYPESPFAKTSKKRIKQIAGLRDSKTFEMKREEKEKLKRLKEQEKLKQAKGAT